MQPFLDASRRQMAARFMINRLQFYGLCDAAETARRQLPAHALVGRL